jgi:hypothetical protein
VTSVLSVCLWSESGQGRCRQGELNDHGGLKLQKAIQLAAEERLTECEMATHLDISHNTLAKLNMDPLFIRRVRQERAVLRVERSAGNKRGGEQTVKGSNELRMGQKRASVAAS